MSVRRAPGRHNAPSTLRAHAESADKLHDEYARVLSDVEEAVADAAVVTATFGCRHTCFRYSSTHS